MSQVLFKGKVIGAGEWVSGAHFYDGRRHYIITQIVDVDHAIYGHYSNNVTLFVVDPATVSHFPCPKKDILEGLEGEA